MTWDCDGGKGIIDELHNAARLPGGGGRAFVEPSFTS